MGKTNNARVALGAAIGVAAGFITGILTAPKSGKETREDIKAGGSKAIKEAEERLKILYRELEELVEQASDKAGGYKDQGKEELDKLVDNAREAQVKAKGVLTAVRSGETTDPDLGVAIEQVKEAKKHLARYLKKPQE